MILLENEMFPKIANHRRYCFEHLVMSRGVDGDVLELGVGTGKTTFLLANVVRDLGLKKSVFACDCFQGLPYNEEASGIESSFKQGDCFWITLDQFKLEINRALLQNVIIPIPGKIEDTLSQQLGDRKFCLAWLDMDLYEPTYYAYKFLEDRISIGGHIGFHDYEEKRTNAILKVVDEIVDKNKYVRVMHRGSSVFFRRVK
jgi:hypothetical protein